MSEPGFFRAHVYASHANLPLPHSTVVLIRRDSGGHDSLLSFQMTDESGNTRQIAVETAERPDAPPAAALDLVAEHPGFERVIVKDIPVYAGVVTLQDLALLPLDALPQDAGEQIVSIPPQTL